MPTRVRHQRNQRVRMSVAAAPSQAALMCQVSAPHPPCMAVMRVRVLCLLSMIALVSIVGCAPYSARLPDVDELAVVERGGHQIGAASLIEDQWELTPTNAEIMEAKARHIDVLGRHVMIVSFTIKNLSDAPRRFLDFSMFHGYSFGLWLGTISDQDGNFAYDYFSKHKNEGGDRACINTVDLPDGSLPSWWSFADAEVDLRKHERVEFVACWNLPAGSTPPYTLYLGSNDTTRITFDLSPVVVDDEPVEKPVDNEHIGSGSNTAG